MRSKMNISITITTLLLFLTGLTYETTTDIQNTTIDYATQQRIRTLLRRNGNKFSRRLRRYLLDFDDNDDEDDDDDMKNLDFDGEFGGNLRRKLAGHEIQTSDTNAERKNTTGNGNWDSRQREIDEAVAFGVQQMYELYLVTEPILYRMGIFLGETEAGSRLGAFRAPSKKASRLAKFGYASLQASVKLSDMLNETNNETNPLQEIKSKAFGGDCPLRGQPRCSPGSKRYRTHDGTCNNLENTWIGAAMLPMQRFLPPSYSDGIQSIRKSILGGNLPSARAISGVVHEDEDHKMVSVTLMLMQWGQFIAHDLVASVQARTYNKSIPQCCQKNGKGFLPSELSHPECLPIIVPEDDKFFGQFGVRCMEFIRSAPATRIDCNLGAREQINQVTSFLDASAIYGSDPEVADTLRLFRSGQLRYGRLRQEQSLRPPDPPEGELCRLGAITSDCFHPADPRVASQSALIALHTVWLRYHNKIAANLSTLNPHWSDEKLYQETRKLIGAMVQHITFREYLPIVLGQKVMQLFEIELLQKGYYESYNSKVDPAPANAFATAAFRFGQSLVGGSIVRFTSKHQPILNNVTLNEEQAHVENIWSPGSLDRLILGLVNQQSERRDEFITKELTNHLFQNAKSKYGFDLTALNIQRGRDHGVPGYTKWRTPCGLTPVKTWEDLEEIMSLNTVHKLKNVYEHVDDIDLFPGGLAEKPVRGGLLGPTFACIVAQQFFNIRKGDRFWYENGGMKNSFTPAQLQEIRKVVFSQVICETLPEVETVQIFAFLVPDALRNRRHSCKNVAMDLIPWMEKRERKARSFPDDIFEALNIDLDNEFDEPDNLTSTTKTNKKTRTKSKYKTQMIPHESTASKLLINGETVKKGGAAFFSVDPSILMRFFGNQYPPQYPNYPPLYPNYPPPTTPCPVCQTSSNMTNAAPSNFTQTNTVDININIDGTPAPAAQAPNGFLQIKATSPRPIIQYEILPSHRPYVQNSYYSNSASTARPFSQYVTKRPLYVYYQDDDVDRVDTTRRPYETVFEEKPFATSGRPQFYRPLQQYRPTTRPIIVPSYVYLDQQQNYDQYKKRPQFNPYSADDPLHNLYQQIKYQQVISQNLAQTDPSKHSLDKTTTTVPGNNDHLQPEPFFGPLIFSTKNKDKNFVKISSVIGQKYPSVEESQNPVYISVHQKEGNASLVEDDAPFVDIDVIPSEVGNDEWKIFNDTDEIMSFAPVFEEKINIVNSGELPSPLLTLTKRRT